MSTKNKQNKPTIGDIRLRSRQLGAARGRVSRSFNVPRLHEIKRVEDNIMSPKNKNARVKGKIIVLHESEEKK